MPGFLSTTIQARFHRSGWCPNSINFVNRWVTVPQRYVHRCFHTKVRIPSSPGAVVPLATLNDWCISSSEIGSHLISSQHGMMVSSSASAVLGKNTSRNALALSWFSVTSSDPTLRVGIFVYGSHGRMYVAVFHRWPSWALSRNSFQWVALTFSTVQVHSHRFWCILLKRPVVVGLLVLKVAQLSYHLLHAWFATTCWALSSVVNHHFEYSDGFWAGTCWSRTVVIVSTSQLTSWSRSVVERITGGWLSSSTNFWPI